MRFTGWMRRRRSAQTTQEMADLHADTARKLLGTLMRQLELSGNRQGRMQRTLPDGTVIIARYDGTTPIVEVDREAARDWVHTGRAAIWAPRGFVVRPADVSATHGRGLPIVPVGTNPYSAGNLRPGLDPTRWTPGGAWNQALMTPDRAAGYPPEDATVAPMFYSNLGPRPFLSPRHDARPTGPTWGGYRPEFVDFRPRSEADNIGARRTVFAQVNAYRIASGLDGAYLMPRGYYRPAQELAILLAQFGARQTSFPRGYTTAVERRSKDGNGYSASGPYTELVAVGGSVTWVMNAWTTQHSAELQITAGKTPLFADVGSHEARTTLTIEPREDWILAGRRTFQSADGGLPPISWDGPPSQNIGFLTWPITYHNHTVYAPLSLYDSNGEFYVRFATGTYGTRPALGPHVYCRGRLLGTVPDGLVLGAGIQVLPDRDRLIVLAHQPSDNVGLTSATQGLTAVAHVWYADFKNKPKLRLHAEQPVTVWKDAGTISVPGIHYLSLWSFAPDGSKACALRDYADAQAVADAMASRYASAQAAGNGFWTWCTNDNLAGDVRALEVFIDAAVTVTVQATALGYSSAVVYSDEQLAHHPSGFPAGVPVVHNGLVPLAADYNAHGSIRIAYAAFAVANVRIGQQPGYADTWQYLYDGMAYQYVGIGGMGAQFERDLEELALYYTDNAVPELDFKAAGVQVLDVSSATFVVSGARNVRAIDYAQMYQFGSYPGAPWRAPFTFSAARPGCLLSTGEASHRVRVYRKGALIDESAWPHPYNDVWHFYYMCTYTAPPAVATPQGSDILAQFPVVMDQFVQPFYAERFGAVIYGYQVGRYAAGTGYNTGKCMPGPNDYIAAINAGSTAITTQEGRPVVGGKWWSDASLPKLHADWLAEAVAV